MFRSRPESLALLKPASPTLRLITVPSFAAPVEQEEQHRITLSSRAFTIELDVLLDGEQLSRDEMGGSGVGQALESWFDEEGEIMGIERVQLLCDNGGLRLSCSLSTPQLALPLLPSPSNHLIALSLSLSFISSVVSSQDSHASTLRSQILNNPIHFIPASLIFQALDSWSAVLGKRWPACFNPRWIKRQTEDAKYQKILAKSLVGILSSYSLPSTREFSQDQENGDAVGAVEYDAEVETRARLIKMKLDLAQHFSDSHPPSTLSPPSSPATQPSSFPLPHLSMSQTSDSPHSGGNGKLIRHIEFALSGIVLRDFNDRALVPARERKKGGKAKSNAAVKEEGHILDSEEEETEMKEETTRSLSLNIGTDSEGFSVISDRGEESSGMELLEEEEVGGFEAMDFFGDERGLVDEQGESKRSGSSDSSEDTALLEDEFCSDLEMLDL